MKYRLTCLLLLFLTIESVSEAQTSLPFCISGRFAEYDLFSDAAIDYHEEIVYAQKNNYLGQPVDLTLNVYHPYNVIDPLQRRPLVVFLPGNEWITASKSSMKSRAIQMARRGYTAVCMEYRSGWNYQEGGLCGGNTYQLSTAMYRATQDVHSALQYLSVHAEPYRIDTSQVYLIGIDAGAVTAISAGYLSNALANTLFPGFEASLGPLVNILGSDSGRYRIRGIVSWCGAAIDTALFNTGVKIPILNLHGMKDSIMPLGIAPYRYCNQVSNPYPIFFGPQAIYQQLIAKGICVESNYDANGEHCFFPSLESEVYVPHKYACFIKNLLCDNCSTIEKISYNIQTCMDAAPLSAPMQEINEQTIILNFGQQGLQIHANTPLSANCSLYLYNLQGQQLASYFIEKGTQNITLFEARHWPPGIYLAALQNKGDKQIFKLHKQP